MLKTKEKGLRVGKNEVKCKKEEIQRKFTISKLFCIWCTLKKYLVYTKFAFSVHQIKNIFEKVFPHLRRSTLPFQCFQRGATAGRQTFSGNALQHNVFNAVGLAELALRGAVAIFVDHEDIGLQALQIGSKVEEAAAAVDKGIVDVADALYHEKALGLWVGRLVVLQFHDRSVGTDANIEIAIGCSLTEELYVAAMEQVVTTAHKYFFIHSSYWGC